MKTFLTLVIVGLLVALTLGQVRSTTSPAVTPGAAGAVNPATTPGAAGQLSPMIVKDVKEVRGYFYASNTTTLKDMPTTLGKVMPALMDKDTLKEVGMSGGPVFVYHGVTAAPDKKFDLEIGLPVAADTKPVGDFKVKSLPAFRAATAYYTGPISGIGQAVGQLYGQIGKAGLRPTDQYRELYFFWEGPESPNNVIELQVGIAGN